MPKQCCVNIGRSADDSMAPDGLKQFFYKTLEVEHRGLVEDEGATDISAGDPQGALPAEVAVRPQKIMMVPEDKEVTKSRWDGFRKQTGSNWWLPDERKVIFEDEDDTMEQRPMKEDPENPYRGAIWALGDEQLPPSQQRAEPAESTLILMKRIEANRGMQKISDAAEMQVDSVSAAEPAETERIPSETQEQSKYWRRESHPLHEKYKHLTFLASYPEDMPNDEYPGGYMKPDSESTYIKGIHRVKKGRLFEATDKSRAYFTSPGAYNSRDPKINFVAHGEHWADDVFGTGVEYPIDDVRCGIVWDNGTHTYALMLAVSFRSRNPRWQHLQMWTNVARMELQSNKWGNPGKTNYFANFRKESEYQDGKFPNAQAFNQEELRVQRMEQRKLDSTKTRE